MDIPTMPINSRLSEQRVALVVADDEDSFDAIRRDARMESPVLLIQVVEILPAGYTRRRPTGCLRR